VDKLSNSLDESKKNFSVELKELLERKVENISGLSFEQREIIIKSTLYQAVLKGKSKKTFWPEYKVDYRYKKNWETKEEFPAIGSDEKEVVNSYDDEIVLMGYGKQLHDFLEKNGFAICIARGCVDEPGNTSFPDYIEASWDLKKIV
jgi:hypothetical protein